MAAGPAEPSGTAAAADVAMKARGASTTPTVVRDGAIGTPSETPAEQAIREALARRVADKNALNGRTL